jgi:adenylate kinase family enzyme
VFEAVKALFAPQVVLALGAPGSGKRTQCARIAAEFGHAHLSMGDLLRGEVARRSDAGNAIAELQADGKPVPDATLLALLLAAVRASPARKFLVDGFPATLAQAAALDAALGAPTLVLSFELPAAAAKARIAARGKGEDGNEAAVVARLAAFESQTAPVVAHYTSRKLVRAFSALPPAAEVFDALRPLFQPQLAVVVGTVGSGRGELAMRAGRELGYHVLHVTPLLKAEVASGSAAGAAIGAALAARRTAPLDATLEVIHRAITASTASRFLLDGFPRLVSAGYPAVHDQVFALEARVGPVKGCIALEAAWDARVVRARAEGSAGEQAQLRGAVDTYRREKLPVLAFFDKLGKAATIDTSRLSADDVYEAARPFLE